MHRDFNTGNLQNLFKWSFSVFYQIKVLKSAFAPPRIDVKMKDGRVWDYWLVHLMGLEQGHGVTAEAAHTKVDPSAPISEIRTLVSPLKKDCCDR